MLATIKGNSLNFTMHKIHPFLLVLLLLMACEEQTENRHHVNVPMQEEDELARVALQQKNNYRFQQSYPFSLGGDSQYTVGHYENDSLPDIYEVDQDAGDYGYQKTLYFLQSDSVFLIQQEGYRKKLEDGRFEGEFYHRKIYLKEEQIDSAYEQTATEKEKVKLALAKPWQPDYLTEGQLHELWMWHHNFKLAPEFQWTFKGIQNIGKTSLFLLAGKEHRQSWFYLDDQHQDAQIQAILDSPGRFTGRPVQVKYSMQEFNGTSRPFLDEVIWMDEAHSPK